MPKENQSGFVFKIWKPPRSATHSDRVTPEISLWVQADHHYLVHWETWIHLHGLRTDVLSWRAFTPLSSNHRTVSSFLWSWKSSCRWRQARCSWNQDCNPSLAWWGSLKIRLTSHWTFSIWLEKICSGILWGTSSLAGCFCFKIDQRSEGWWRFGSKCVQN